MAKNKVKIENSEVEVPPGYLTLKEAASLTDYTPDYIGQLVRAGKIEGKQVYSSVAWVTSEDSLRQYLALKGKDLHGPHEAIVAELPELARPLLYVVIGCAVMLLVILLHIFSITIDRALTASLDVTPESTPTTSVVPTTL
jgi:hypothetical protein